MTREEALSQLAGTWQFKEVDGLIKVREVALIGALDAHAAEQVSEQAEFVQAPATDYWGTR